MVLHRLDHGEGLTLFEVSARLRQCYGLQVSQRLLRMIGDTDLERAIRQGPHPRVVLGVLEVRGNSAHGQTPSAA
jgi:hypothetical protein